MNQNQFLETMLRGTGLTMTQSEATDFGIMNLSARMSEFRQRGLKVTTLKTEDGETAYKVSRRSIFGNQFKRF